MNLMVNFKLWRAKKSISPEQKFKVELWKKLDKTWDEKYGRKPAWLQMSALQRGLAFSLVLFLVLGLGTATYAYSSPQVTEDSPLYFVKKNIENFEEKLQTEPEQKARFYLKKIERREEEKKVLSVKGKKVEKIEEEINKTEEKLEKADEMLSKTPVKDKQLVEKIKTRLQKRQLKRVEQLEEKLDKLNALLENAPTGSLRIPMGNNGIEVED